MSEISETRRRHRAQLDRYRAEREELMSMARKAKHMGETTLASNFVRYARNVHARVRGLRTNFTWVTEAARGPQ